MTAASATIIGDREQPYEVLRCVETATITIPTIAIEMPRGIHTLRMRKAGSNAPGCMSTIDPLLTLNQEALFLLDLDAEEFH